MTTTSRVLVVRTVHRATGRATAAELYWLLGRLDPDVIFLEYSATEVATYPDTMSESLELAAVMRYREHKSVELVPVGVDIADAATLRQTVEPMFERIEEASPRYCRLRMAHDAEIWEAGLAFLNSPRSARLQSEMQRELQLALDALADPVLTDVHGLWTRTNHHRELAMLSRIEEFARGNQFRRAVLLVGAAHWQSLIDESRKQSTESDHGIAWDFEWELDEIDRDPGPIADGRLPT